MHASSYREMGRFVDRYVRPLLNQGPVHVADLGSYDVNGTNRPLFALEGLTYTGLDVEAGPNVDVVLPELYHWPEVPFGAYDVVISSNTLEHIPQPWLWILEATRILKPGGLMCIIAPNTCAYHRYPVDCWRVWPDGLQGLFTYAQLTPISVYISPESNQYGSGIVGDTIGIARKG